jgi:alpha-soluble NSF attachment protein
MVESTNYLQMAQETTAQAEKKLKPGLFGKMFSNKVDRMEEAAELFKQAANYFRLAKDYSSSARAFLRCADLLPDDAAQYFSEAANVVRKVNTGEAVTYYNKAVEILARSGRIGMAAKLRKQIAEIYEQDDCVELAFANYEQAAELFEMDNTESTANSCLLKAAELSTSHSLDQATVVKAIQIFEKVAQRFLMHQLTRFSAKECYFKASCLYLALEVSLT